MCFFVTIKLERSHGAERPSRDAVRRIQRKRDRRGGRQRVGGEGERKTRRNVNGCQRWYEDRRGSGEVFPFLSGDTDGPVCPRLSKFGLEEKAMNAYLASVIENVKKKHGNEPEFVQTVEEVFSSLEPVIEKHPEYEKVDGVLGGRPGPVAHEHRLPLPVQRRAGALQGRPAVPGQRVSRHHQVSGL